MSKWTRKKIDAHCDRMLLHYQRLLAAGEISQKDHDEGLRDLAQWAGHKYAVLPTVQAIEAMQALVRKAGGR